MLLFNSVVYAPKRVVRLRDIHHPVLRVNKHLVMVGDLLCDLYNVVIPADVYDLCPVRKRLLIVHVIRIGPVRGDKVPDLKLLLLLSL